MPRLRLRHHQIATRHSLAHKTDHACQRLNAWRVASCELQNPCKAQVPEAGIEPAHPLGQEILRHLPRLFS